MRDLKSRKSRARVQARSRRAKLIASGNATGVEIELLRHFVATRFRGEVTAGFWPIGDEINIHPLLSTLADMGQPLALPCTGRAGQPLTFRRWQPGQKLKRGAYGTREPNSDVAILSPDLIFVPLLAFTRDGKRLGYGGGYYDRTLASLRRKKKVFACGVAFAGQEVDYIPIDDYDQRLDGILTEKEFYEI